MPALAVLGVVAGFFVSDLGSEPVDRRPAGTTAVVEVRPRSRPPSKPRSAPIVSDQVQNTRSGNVHAK